MMYMMGKAALAKTGLNDARHIVWVLAFVYI